MATSAVGVARAKAAQAGLRHRWQLLPHKSGSSFGRWAPYLQIPPRQGPLHSLKGMVPEAAAHVPVVVCGRCVGGSAAQRRSSTPASAGMRRWQLACDYTMLATELASDFDSLCSSWQLACDFSSRYALLCLCCCYVPGSSFGRWSPLVGLGHKSRRTHSLKGIVPEVAAHVSVLLGLHIISDGLTSFQTDSNTHQQVSGQGSCCPCCAIGPLTSSPAASRASSSLVS